MALSVLTSYRWVDVVGDSRRSAAGGGQETQGRGDSSIRFQGHPSGGAEGGTAKRGQEAVGEAEGGAAEPGCRPQSE